MSRMFIQVKSDKRNQPIRSSSDKENTIEVRWGSMTESKLLFKINTIWDSETNKPIVFMQSDGSIPIKTNLVIAESDNYRGVKRW